ncbi:heliorhodopsin HeR [uncultured Nocardioides sp.]|uniref:Heliorhodopsin n=1 Tax=uncultured Nocardioides sp. TaxID=198441 RepID=A0A6J4P1Z3_9ACTN|nr:heliorhodopsin HeR [uncultured Nocardioides sp.]CAA9404094.1 MAG: Heliorhodopsin [uncultured Nocardioides sp.]
MTGHEHSSRTAPPAASGVDDARLAGLRRWNLGLTVLHTAQAVAVLVLATDFAIDLSTAFPEGPPGTRIPAPSTAFSVPVGAAIAAFLALAALDHGMTATVLRGRYESDLRRGINRFRWIEYSVSATIMVLLIAFYAGITQLTTAIAIIGANVAMILFGWLQEEMNPPGRSSTTMLPFWFGCVAGAAPWAAITLNIVGAETIPGFVYGIFFSLFVFFMSFALNQYLQYREVGPWRSYAFGEKAYLVLSLGAKSALAWQVFAGSLAG